MDYDYWSPFASGENFSHQLSLIGRNVGTVFQFLATFDGVGVLLKWFGVGTLVFGLALFAKRPWTKNWLAARWRWMVVPLICLGGVYLPVYVLPVDQQRYFYLFLPLIMILTLGLVSPFFARKWLVRFILAFFFLSPLLWPAPSRYPAGSFAQTLANQMEKAGMVGPIVGSTFVGLTLFPREVHRLGLYVAWHLGQPWHGDLGPFSTEAYKTSGARFTIALENSSLSKQLDADVAFKNVSAKLGEKGSLQVYEIQESQP